MLVRYKGGYRNNILPPLAIFAMAAILASCAGGKAGETAPVARPAQTTNISPAYPPTSPVTPARTDTPTSPDQPASTDLPASPDQPVAAPQGGPLVIYTPQQAATVCYIQPTEELRKKLSPEEYDVLVQAATEPPFANAYWDNHRAGIYVDRIDGTPLFASSTKFESGTGWPSFWNPIDASAIVLVEDHSFGMNRIEVRAKKSGGHLGHLFDDGPKPSGLRYCINSASLDFIPTEEMAARGYGEYLGLVSK